MSWVCELRITNSLRLRRTFLVVRYVWFARIGLHWHGWRCGNTFLVADRKLWLGAARRCILHFRAFDLYLILFVITFHDAFCCFAIRIFCFVAFYFLISLLFSILFNWNCFVFFSPFSTTLFSFSFSLSAFNTQVCNAVYVRLNYTQPLCACPSR